MRFFIGLSLLASLLPVPSEGETPIPASASAACGSSSQEPEDAALLQRALGKATPAPQQQRRSQRRRPDKDEDVIVDDDIGVDETEVVVNETLKNWVQLVIATHSKQIRLDMKYEELGCYPMSVTDRKVQYQAGAPQVTYFDKTCVPKPNEAENIACRSGFPWYSWMMPAGMDYLSCANFCLSKGLDLAGVLADTAGIQHECRCGATQVNVGAWNRVLPRSNLLFDATGALPVNDPNCAIMAFRYQGAMEDLGVPFEFQSKDEDDSCYLREVLFGELQAPPAELMQLGVNSNGTGTGTGTEISHHLNAQEKQEVLHRMAQWQTMHPSLIAKSKELAEKAKEQGMCADLPDTGLNMNGKKATCYDLKPYCDHSTMGTVIKASCPYSCKLCRNQNEWEPCYPDNCGSGGGPWKTRQSDGTFNINYYFSTGMDGTRQNAFLAAIREWESQTCVRFVQSTSYPRVKVYVADTSSCYATTGYVESPNEGQLNMGFCKSTQELGSIIHELGHIMGMTHTQRRPDATGKIYLPDQNKYEGPYLTMHWQNIASSWQSQYTPEYDSYTGSNNQQTGDPFAGYAPYDYGSIMHYARQEDVVGSNRYNFDVVNPGLYGGYVGQRSKPSAGDILNIKDMYQCGTAGESGPRRRRGASSGGGGGIWNWFGFGYDQVPGVPNDDTWVGKPWSNCVVPDDLDWTNFQQEGPRQCKKFRDVHCMDISGSIVDDNRCQIHMKPDTVEMCSCEDVCGDLPVHFRPAFQRSENRLSCHQMQHKCDDLLIRQVCGGTCSRCGPPTSANDLPRVRNCKDMSPLPGIKVKNVTQTCAQLKEAGLCAGLAKSTKVAERCPETCGTCPVEHHYEKDCHDDPAFTDTHGRKCEFFSGFECVDAAVKEACPDACGLC
eukprot:CAMPEP_0197643328 /NCGR_PEP_ID=MMETSP1338-20131121/16686_1 /TAXON_ID=43686 ORGANISM="Pelagodinium beii, Strain RCC1491" /NCGR_SAMPLE_ID=MMETSP1338 /ASSEMBLY_ACC=CAM_ASM_000754 /LENGTH=890 /DNA_ID=CAMNT_0043216573 /DNA_START=54 /DNA_END=2726 /DNA_ORIENTATION=-